MAHNTMPKEQWEGFKKKVHYANKKADSAKMKTLWERAEAECSPQQRGALIRMMRDYEEMCETRELSAVC